MPGRSLMTCAVAVLFAVAVPGRWPCRAIAHSVTEIIDTAGDGAGNGLVLPRGIAVDGAGNVYVAGIHRDNAFKITPAGVITEIIDATGDGAGNGLDGPVGIAVDAADNVYVTGIGSIHVPAAVEVRRAGRGRDLEGVVAELSRQVDIARGVDDDV